MNFHDGRRSNNCNIDKLRETDNFPGRLIDYSSHMLSPTHKQFTHNFISAAGYSKLFSIFPLIFTVFHIVIFFVFTSIFVVLTLNHLVLFFLFSKSGNSMSVFFKQYFVVIWIGIYRVLLTLLLFEEIPELSYNFNYVIIALLEALDYVWKNRPLGGLW